MFVAELTFRKKRKQVTTDDASNAFGWLLAALLKNGQILADNQVAEAGNVFKVYVSLPASDALASEHNSEYVQKCYAELATAGLSQPVIRIVGRDPSQDLACDCKKSKSYILFTHLFLNHSPLRCGDCFCPVPLYRIPPISGGEYLDLRSWMENYQACDRLWLNSTVGEKYAQRQKEDFASQLTRQGMALCRGIEKNTHIPTYYYLNRYKGRDDEFERNKKCPSCAGEWSLRKRLHRLFDFRCRKCRLLSNLPN